MTTLATLQTNIAAALRDSANSTFTTTELTAFINRGLNELGGVYPREIVNTSTTVSSGVYSYALPTGMTYPYRVDIYTDAGSYYATLAPSRGEGPNDGWQVHNGTLYLPPGMSLTTGYTLHLYGYGVYTQLSATSDTTDLDTVGEWAVLLYAQMAGLKALTIDRALFQQWQADANNTDVTPIAVGQLYQIARRDWTDEKTRLRKLRKSG